MLNQFSRTEIVIGRNNLAKLAGAHVCIFGIGGVGGYVVEALARSGVGEMTLIDDDKVCLTNINRQILATRKTVGQYKVDAAEERIHAICPDIKINKFTCFYLPSEREKFDFTQYDYIIDCIDTVTAKLDIIEEAQRVGIPILSCMGCGNRIDPSKLTITDIFKTKGDPLARVMRTECRKRKIQKLKVVYSTEQPIKPLDDPEISCRTNCICPPGTKRKCTDRRDIPGSTAFVPAAAGILAASVCCQDIMKFDVNTREITGEKVHSFADLIKAENNL